MTELGDGIIFRIIDDAERGESTRDYALFDKQVSGCRQVVRVEEINSFVHENIPESVSGLY